MRRNNQRSSLFQQDFRKRFAQRDLEISKNEYEYLNEKYLESESAKKKAASDKVSSDTETPLTNQAQDDSMFRFQYTPSEFNPDLYKKPEGKKKGAPEEKLEHHLDITLPTIQSLSDDYSKPFVYDYETGNYKLITDSWDQIAKNREAIQNRPSPFGISSYEDAYMRATDPANVLKQTRDKYKVQKEESVNNTLDTLSNIMSAPFHIFGDWSGDKMKNFIDGVFDKNREYIDDVISTWAVGKNNAEFDAYVDAGIRLGEKQQYANIIKQYSDNIDQYTKLQNAYENSTNAGERYNLLLQMNNLLAKNSELKPAVEEAVTYTYDTDTFKTFARNFVEFVNNGLNNKFVNVIMPPSALLRAGTELTSQKVFGKDDVGANGKQLLDLIDSSNLKPGEPLSQDFLDRYNTITGRINKLNEDFQKASKDRILRDKEMALKNKQEAMEWEAWHTPSREFKAKEHAAQDNYLTKLDTYKYGIWGVLGSSAAFNGILLLSTGLDWLGIGLLMSQHPGAKIAGAGATAAGGVLGLASGVYENRAEITQNYIQGFQNDLQKEGLLREFLDEGRKQLKAKGIEIREDQDIFRHFILKDYKTNNPVIQDLALRHMFGANNAFQNDMMAVSADVAVNAGINLFGATGQVAEALKIWPEGSKFSLLRKVAQEPVLAKAYHSTSGVGGRFLVSTISPLANIPYTAIKPIIKATKDALKPMVEEGAKYMDRALSWSKVAPKGIFNTRTTGKYVFDFLGKTATRGFSESIEEGKQYEYGKMFSEGKFAGKSNTMFGTMIDDLSTGLYTGALFIGHQFFGMQSDRLLMSNMRGGFIGGILNHGAVITAVLDIINARGEINAGSVIFNNIMAEKIRQRANLVNGEEMGKYTSRSGYAAMMNAFDRAQAIHDRINNDATDRVGLTKETLELQRNLFRRISALSNSERVILRAKDLGIKQGTSDFRKLVSIINLADQILTENIGQYNDIVEQSQNILQEDGLSLNVAQLFEQARALSTSADQLNAVDAAEEFAKWVQPLNNQIMGQYSALNKLIEELEDLGEFLTPSQRRSLNHYIAQRDKLDKEVARIRQEIGGTENMDFLNYGDPEVLTKYSQIYRTLYQASAQLEMSSVVLDAMYGKNDSRDLANDFVKEQLDFIADRINEASKDKKTAVKSLKKSKNKKAKEFLEQYKKSLNDDIELMAELADRFDNNNYDYNNRIDSGSAPQTEEAEREDEAATESPSEGALGLPVSIYDKTPLEGKQFEVGTKIESPSNPNTLLTVTGTRVNPTTGQYLIEAVTDEGESVQIDQNSVAQYQRVLQPPMHYERVLEVPDEFTKLKQDSPLALAVRKSSIKNLPSVINTELQDYLLEVFRRPLFWDPWDGDPQAAVVEQLGSMLIGIQYNYWNPLFGAIMPGFEQGTSIYIPSVRDIVPQLYDEFPSERKKRELVISIITALRNDNKINEIRDLLRDNNVADKFIDVLDDDVAVNAMARAIIANGSRTMDWLLKHALYTDAEYLDRSGLKEIIATNGELIFQNVTLGTSIADATADIITVDKNGRVKVYILSFPRNVNDAERNISYYNALGDALYSLTAGGLQYHIDGIYVLPITGVIHQPIPVSTDTVGQHSLESEIVYRNAAARYYNDIRQEVAGIVQKTNAPGKTRPEAENDLSQETRISEIGSAVKQLEDTISDVYSGKLSFNGRIQSEARQYLENIRPVLNKYRNALKEMASSEQLKLIIDRIQTAYDRIILILQTYTSDRVYNAEDIVYSGPTVKSHIAFIPVGHPLESRSTSGIPVTATSDFIVDSKVELMYGWYNPQNGEFTPMSRYSTHPGVGVYAQFTYNGVKYAPVLVQPSHYKEGVLAYTTEGALFIMDVITLLNQANGLPIIGLAKRMIPSPVYKGTPKKIAEIPALHFTEDDIQDLNSSSDKIGITNASNRVQHVDKEEDKSVLWQFSSSLAGSIYLLHSFNFKEYQDGGVTPVKLIPAKLSKSDVDVVVNILKQNALQIINSGRSIMTTSYALNNGKEAPLTNGQVLQLLTMFDENPNDASMFWIDMMGNVYFKQRRTDPTPQPINILTPEGESTFRNLISNGYELAHSKEVLKGNMGNPNDLFFGKLHTWVTLNGALKISDNLVFDKDDVSRNGKGYFGIGWAIKHGRLLSNLSSIYEPSIQIEQPAISNNTEQPVIDQPASTGEPKVTKKPKARYIPEDGTLLSAEETLSEEPLDEEEAREDIRKMLGDAAVEFVDNILGILSNGLKAVAATFDNVIVISRLASVGTQFHEAFHRIVELVLDEKTRLRVYKAFANLNPEVDSTNPRSITEGLAEDYRKYATNRKYSSKWKRYFDKIKRFVQMMFSADRRVLYKLYRDAYNGKYKNIMPSKENIERFNRIFATTLEGTGVLYHTIYDASTGERINLLNVPSALEYRTAINTIVDNIVAENGVDIFGSSVAKVKFDIEAVKKLGAYKAFVGDGEYVDDINKIFIDIFDNWDHVMGDVAISLKRFGLNFRHKRGTNTIETYKTDLSEEEQKAIDEAEEGKAKTADINQYELQDYEISKLRKMSEKTKFFFATIPDIRFVEEDDEEPMYIPETNSRGEEIDINGRVIKTDPETKLKFIETEDGSIITGNSIKVNMVRNTTYNLNDFGFRQFAPFYATCNIALNRCYSANSLYELLDLFRKVAIEYPLFNIIAQRFSSLLDNFKLTTKDGYYVATDGRLFRRMDNGLYQLVIGKDKFGEEWYNADEIDFQIQYDKQSMAVSVFNNISGTKLQFRNIRSTRPSKEAIVFQTMDTDNGYSAVRYSQSWHSTFLGDNLKVRTSEVTRNGERIIVYKATNVNLFKDVADNLTKLLEAYTNRRSEGWTTGRVTIDGVQLNINRDPEAVKAAYLKQLNKIGITVTKEQFDHLLFMMFGKTDANAIRRYFQQDGEDFGRTKGVSIFKFILAIQQGVQLNGELSRPVVSGSFYLNIGAVTLLADAIHSYNQQQSERMQTAPGKNKYYSIANRNAQDLMLQEMNTPGGIMISDLLKSAYHAGSIYLDKLNTGSIILSSCTNAGYESDNKSDFGADFMQITNAEDVISKITMLLDGYIVPPTLSNKKTYQPILIKDAKTGQVIYLPGTLYIANRNNVQTDNADAEVYNAINIPVLVDKTYDGEFITMSGKLSKSKPNTTPRQFVVSDDVYDALIKYAFSEYESILLNLEIEKNMRDSEKVVNFDTATKGAKIPGALRFSRFYELYIPVRRGDNIEYDTIDLNDDNSSVEENLNNAKAYFFGDDVSREQRIAIINEILERVFDKNLEYFRKVGIIRYRTNWRNFPKYCRYEPVAIDTAHLNAIAKAYGNTAILEGPISARSIATCALLFDVCLKHQIANEEYQRMFAGNPGLYVSLFEDGHVIDDTGDLSKRLGGHVSTGETQCELDDVPKIYNCAELKDYKIASEQKDDLLSWFDESESRSTLYASKLTSISIAVLSIRDSMMALAPAIRNKVYSADSFEGLFPGIFDKIEESRRQAFAEALEMISKSSDKASYNSAVSHLESMIDEYKYDQISSEYKRQAQLSLDEVKQELKDNNLLSGVETRVAAYSSNYGSSVFKPTPVNVADGASYVSPQMVKWMLLSIGKFSGKVYKAWNALLSDDILDPLNKSSMYKEIMDALFGTQKYTATGYRMNNGRPIFYYNKTALFPLFKQIAYGRTKDILRLMEKDNVHMLMFESAVKFGSEGKQNFPTTKEELNTFKFNVYQQNMKWLRKQLNTDPNEEELMAVGTQTKKIALTILDIYKDDYIKRDGSVEDGKTLRDRIFLYDKQLAYIGFEELRSKFASEQELVSYLRDNLSDRDADGDTLQGLSMIQNESTGQKEMLSPLEGLSNSEWIQSIITSLANKHIVDVNLPGSAFIQRSVFSMEGNSIFGDDQIPSISKLKISNDWSSMDAVVSIDYFYQQFPKLQEMGFFEARQWLIDHNIIGENAKADTVAYRIPTQANSSIHALRFVDVISTVRDTIVLPAEFTAITGSDFDIDKLFLSTKYYSVDEQNRISTEFDKTTNAKQYYGNALLECYLELLTQPKKLYANQLVRSIDYDTEIPKKVVRLLEQGKSRRVGTYDALQLYKQCQIKAQNRTGGIGVGPYALNNNNNIMSRLFEVECANVGIVKALDISRLYDLLDAEGDAVMATIGAFISGHVDIAKGPWVTLLNINEYTYDIHIYLARAGLGLRALWFCSQPVMRKIADIYIQSGGYLYDSKNESPYVRRKRAFDEFEKSVFVNGNAWYQRMIDIARKYNTIGTAEAKSQKQKEMAQQLNNALYVILEIFGVDHNEPSKKINVYKTIDGTEHEGTILLDIALNHSEEEDIYDPTQRYIIQIPTVKENGQTEIQSIPISTKDVQFFVYLANVMLNDPVSDMKKLVQLSKIETKKQGKNRAELLSYDMLVEQFFGGNTRMMLPNTVFRMGNNSAILTKQRLFMKATEDMLRSQLLQYSAAYEQFASLFIAECKLRKDAATVKSVLNGITSWQKYQFIRRYANQHGINIRDLFIGNESIYNTLGRIKNLIIDYPAVYSKYTDGNGRITNALISMLLPSYIPAYVLREYGETLPKFVDFLINQDDSSATTADVKAGWELMLNDTEHPDIQEFARRLVVYAFMTSGDTNVFGGFFKKVPLAWRTEHSRDDKDNSYIDYVKELIEKSNNEIYKEEDGWMIDPEFIVPNESVFVQILKNNWFDDNLVPTIQETSRDALGRSVNNYFEYINNGQPILVALIKTRVDEHGITHYSEASMENPKAVIKIHKHDHDSYRNPQDFRLYRFIRMGSVINENGDLVHFPIYGRTAPTGGLMYGHTIIQYGDDLEFGWEHEVLHYDYLLDEKFQEGLALIYDWFDLNLDRNKDAVSKGVVTMLELREDTLRSLEDTSIKGTFEDGTPVELTSSNSYQFYNMAKMMSQYLMVHPPKHGIGDYHNDSLNKIKLPVNQKLQTKEGVIENWNVIKNTENTESHGVHLSSAPANFMAEYKDWLLKNPDGIVAYRVDVDKFNSPEFVLQGVIGNPFDFRIYGAKLATNMFVDWVINGNAYGEEKATEAFRQAVIDKILSTEKPNIFYYKELGYHSHATALGYLIENKDVLFAKKQEESKKSIDIWSTNRDKYSNLSNVAVRTISVTPSIYKAISDVLGTDVAKQVQSTVGQDGTFNSVEQLFLITKFEYMKNFVKLRANELYGLDKLAIAKAKTPEARTIKQILQDIANKEERMLNSNGSAITSISHEAIPDINGIINTEFWEKWNPGGPENYKNWPAYKVLREIMMQSFLLNEGATRLLMSTVGAELTHEKASAWWKEAFPAALTSVRDEIAKTYLEIQNLEDTAITMLGGDKIAYEEYTMSIKNALKGINYDDVTPFFTPEEALQIQAAIPVGTNLRVYSASRHTDPVFFATDIINRLRENSTKPFTDASRINVIELWSKHDGIPIQNILEACKKYRVAPMVSFSITSLGGSVLEKGVLKSDDLLDNIQKLIDQGILDPRVTTFRVDPILPGITRIEDLRHIIERGVSMGIRKFVTSPMLTYSTQKDRSRKSRSVIPHIDAALMADPNSIARYPQAITPQGGYNWMKYYGLHPNQQVNPGAIAFIPKKDAIKPYVDLFNEMMAKHNITILSCAVAMGNLLHSACLDPAIIEAVTSLKVNAIEDSTRPFCRCYGVHSDLFRMNDECKSSCLYCYQGWGSVSPFDYYEPNGKLKDFAYAKVNDYNNHLLADQLDEPVKVMIKDKEYIYNNDTGRVTDDLGNQVDTDTTQRVIWKLAMDLGKAHYSLINGIYYVVTNTGLIFNWNTAKVENLPNGSQLKKELIKNTQGSYEKPYVSTLFNVLELKQLGESRMKFCKTKR